MNASDKTAVLMVNLTPERLEEFRITAMLRGTTMSSLIQEHVDLLVEEEKLTTPHAFRQPHLSNPKDDYGLD